MPLQSLMTDYLHRGITRWRQRRTIRIIRTLPREIQKDIGWPVSEEAQRRRLYEQKSFWERRA